VTSVIPDNNSQLKIYFEIVNAGLKAMFNRHRDDEDERFHYVDLYGKHLEVQSDGTRYDPELYADRFHLNKAGAEKLAVEIVNKLPSIPNRAFGWKHQSKKSHLRKLAYEQRMREKRTEQAARRDDKRRKPATKHDYGHDSKENRQKHGRVSGERERQDRDRHRQDQRGQQDLRQRLEERRRQEEEQFETVDLRQRIKDRARYYNI
jgi:hypothetical protein